MMQTFSATRFGLPRFKGQAVSSCHHGFTMVEFMVTAFVFAIGVLGLTALQVATMKYSTSGRSRVTASYIIDQCMQRIQMDGQRFYAMKLNHQTPTAAETPAWFNTPGDAIARTYFAGFNRDGIRITTYTPGDSATTLPIPLPSKLPEAELDTLFSDITAPQMERDIKRTINFWAFYERAATQGNVASTSRVEHFTIRVVWFEDTTQKSLDISRNIRF